MTALRLLRTLITAGSLCAIALMWLLTTTSGSKWVIKLVNDYTPIEIHYSGGTLASRFELENVRLSDKNEEQLVVINSLSIQINFNQLLQKQLKVETLNGDKITMNLPPTSKQVTPEKKPGIAEILQKIDSPWDVYLESVSFNEIVIIKPEESEKTTRYPISSVALSASLINNKLSINDLNFKYQDILVESAVDLGFRQPNPINMTTSVLLTDLQVNSQIHLTGEINNYSLNIRTDNDNKNYPFSQLVLNALGDLNQLRDITGNIATDAGKISFTGNVKYLDQPSAELILTGLHLNPAKLNADIRGDVSVSAHLKYRASELVLSSGLTGQLQDYPIRLDIESNYKNKRINLQQIDLKSGPNSAVISGHITTDTYSGELLWDIDSPQLDALHPQLTGSAIGKGNVQLLKGIPIGQGTFTATQLAYLENSIESIVIDLQSSGVAAQAEYDLAIYARNINGEDQKIEHININGGGTLASHQMTVKAKSTKLGSLSFIVDGGFKQQQWQGTLDGLSIKSQALGSYQQQSPGKIVVSGKKLSTTPICLTQKQESLCIESSIFPESGNKTIKLQLNKFPIKRLSPWLPQAKVINDNISIQADLLEKNGQWKLDSHSFIDRRNYAKINNLTITDNAFTDGSIDINFEKAIWLTLFSDALLKPKGTIRGQLQPRGQLSSPTVKGSVLLRNGSFLLPATGIEINNITSRLILTDLTMGIVQGNANSGNGHMNFSGTVNWNDGLVMSLSIGGNNFTVVELEGLSAVASPDLILQLKNSNTTINGRILLPKIEVTVLKPPASSASVSEDEVITNRKEQAAILSRNKSSFSSNINLILGDEVTIKGEGADFKVSGKIQLLKNQNLPIQTFGTVTIDAGTYQAYGQDLSIRKGEIYLAGQPNNPGINIEAVRVQKDITTGLILRGTVNKPLTTVFSEPALPETEALSYLLTGRSLTETSSAENNILLSAITKFGIKGSAGFVSNLKNKTGLSALEIQAGDNSTDTSILLGKYLTPQLYIQYVKRLFDNKDTASMRYEISPKLSLEAESGTSQGIDLIYEFESN